MHAFLQRIVSYKLVTKQIKYTMTIIASTSATSMLSLGGVIYIYIELNYDRWQNYFEILTYLYELNFDLYD